MEVRVRGGRVYSSGSVCVDVYPPRGVAIMGEGSGARDVWASLGARSVVSSRCGVEGPMGVTESPIAGLWGRERFGHGGVRKVVVYLW